jgi:poly(3-hydroxybutyrate) depolymerase
VTVKKRSIMVRRRIAKGLLAVVGALLAVTAVMLVSPHLEYSASPAVDGNQSFTASNGLTSEYHVYTDGLSTTDPLCAVFEFHGDGAYEFLHPDSAYSLGGPNGIIETAHRHGCLTVPVLSPDKTGTVTWWENGAANAGFFSELLTQLVADYHIDSHQIWLVGYSGGAQFITQFYLPLYSSQIDAGGAVMFGGGGTPYAVQPRRFAPSLIAHFQMFWFTGADDDGATSADGYNAIRDAKNGEAYYAAHGFATSHEYPANTTHKLDGRFGGILDQQLG